VAIAFGRIEFGGGFERLELPSFPGFGRFSKKGFPWFRGEGAEGVRGSQCLLELGKRIAPDDHHVHGKTHDIMQTFFGGHDAAFSPFP
jgi:hypothetical protein